MVKKIPFTIGTDPEFPLKDTESGEWVSATNFVYGTKNNPTVLPNGALLQHDNVALEFAPLPVSDEKSFIGIIEDTFKRVKRWVPNNVDIIVVPSAHFGESQLQHPATKEFGCSPDFNAYTGEENPSPGKMGPSSLRTFGGHVHVGGVKESSWLREGGGQQISFVKFLDTTLGVMASILDNSPESLERKKLYGKAGAYRLPEHGIEYRTLSNFWFRSKDLVSLVYNTVKDSVTYASLYDIEGIISNMGEVTIQKTVNEGNPEIATEWIKSFFKFEILSGKTAAIFDRCLANKNTVDNSIYKIWRLAA